MKVCLLAVTALLCGASGFAAINLAGQWDVTLQDGTKSPITLPGTLSDAKLGTPAAEATYGALTPRYQYVGQATYTRTIDVPEAEAGNVRLSLERVLWRSRVKIDNQEIAVPEYGMDSFGTPHTYDFTITPGKHTVTIEVDNSRIYKITEKGHAYGDSMQTRWNGVIGQMTLERMELAQLRDVQIYPDAKQQKLRLTAVPKSVTKVELIDADGLRIVGTPVVQAEDGKTGECIINLAGEVQLWSPDRPHLYTLALSNQFGTVQHKFGFRNFERRGNKFYLNGNSFFQRGNIDNCHFPLTGYPAMDKATWVKLFAIQKEDGANTMRFHSWCPPKAAFDAADEVGMLLQPEAGIWIDGWMAKDFPDVVGLGRGNAAVDGFTRHELLSILAAYGNHASFYSLSVGNELGSSDFDLMDRWMAECKSIDPRHLYAASTARKVTPHDDFTVTHSYPGIGMVRERLLPSTEWDYESLYSRTTVPCVAHEIGQWPVYPLWREIDDYTGLLRAWNLEKLRDVAVKAGTVAFDKRYHNASIKTHRLVYKEEVESFMRTASCAGIDLLGMQDYSGQGEALIGWLDSFYKRKPGLEEAVPFATFFGDDVPLFRINKFTFWQNETPKASVQWRNNSLATRPAGQTGVCRIVAPDGSVTETKLQLATALAPNTLTQLFPVALPTSQAGRYTVELKQLEGAAFNRWNYWVYPKASKRTAETGTLISSDWAECKIALAEGKKVLFLSRQSGKRAFNLPATFKPVYWSTTWFPGQKASTLGMAIQAQAPALKGFPTEDWCDWQWYRLVQGATALDVTGLSDTLESLIMPVPDFHHSRPLTLLMEGTVAKGKLLICGLNLDGDAPEMITLRNQLSAYVASAAFNPSHKFEAAALDARFATPTKALAARPKIYSNAPVYIECAARLQKLDADTPWKKSLDRAELAAGSYDLTGEQLRTWADKDGCYWVGNKLCLTLSDLPPIRGKLLVRFRDPNKNNRTARGVFEGRAFVVPAHADNHEGAFMLELPVDMEDTLDKVLKLEINKVTGSNIMIDRVIYLPNE